MFFEKNKEIIESISSLDELEIKALILELLDKKVIDFIDISKSYIHVLEEQKKQSDKTTSSLVLMLGNYCLTDTSPHGKTSRRYIFESGYYGNNDGSKFGKMLDEEFNNQKDTGSL